MVNVPRLSYAPIAQTSPFVYSEGVTYLKMLDDIKLKVSELINNELLQNAQYADIIDTINQALAEAEQAFNELAASFNDQYTDISAIQQNVTQKLANLDAAVTAANNAVTTANQAVADADTLTNQTLAQFNTDFTNFKNDVNQTLASYDNSSTIAGKVDKDTLFYNVRDYGAVGDGTTDDTTSIKNAVAAAGKNGVVYFPKGKYLVTSVIVMPTDQQWIGTGIDDKDADIDASQVSLVITNVSSGFAVQATYNTKISNMKFLSQTNAAGTIGLSCHGSVYLDNVSVMRYDTGIVCQDLYYGTFTRVRTWRNNIGIDVRKGYNISIRDCRINAQRMDNAYGIGVKVGNTCQVQFYGGAIEGFLSGISFANGSDINVSLYSVYFEVNSIGLPASFPGATCVDMSYGSNVNVTAIGCEVFLNNVLRFVNAYGIIDDSVLNSQSNLFKGGSPASVGYATVAYRWSNNIPLRTYLLGDSWNMVTNKTNVTYYESTLRALGNSINCPPEGSMGVENVAMFTGANVVVQAGSDSQGTALTIPQASVLPTMDSTNGRNTRKGALIFYQNKLCMWDGAAWRDVNGYVTVT